MQSSGGKADLMRERICLLSVCFCCRILLIAKSSFASFGDGLIFLIISLLMLKDRRRRYEDEDADAPKMNDGRRAHERARVCEKCRKREEDRAVANGRFMRCLLVR